VHALAALFALTSGQLSDSSPHPPPLSGPYAYYPTAGTFGPDQPGFFGVGQTYVDPVFGTSIHRLSDQFPEQAFSDIYATNGWWNADGTHFLLRTPSGVQVFEAATGAVVRAGVPQGYESSYLSFDPVDPDVYYFRRDNDPSLYAFHVSSGAETTVKTFAAALESLGGSVDYIDRTGRYFVVNYGGQIHVWDRQQDMIFGGAIPNDFGQGWVGISPDAKWLVMAADGSRHTSHALDLASQTIDPNGTLFWTLCGDHGDLVSASDGRTYLVTFECYDVAAVYRVDVALPQTAGDVAQQRQQNRMLFDTDWADSGHFSCASKGTLADWCYVSIESGDDTFADMGTWRPYKQEIVMAQVVPPFEVKRLAHHRSRNLNCGAACNANGYYYTPRISASWDGTKAAWASNFGYGGAQPAEYSDVYWVGVPELAGDADAATADVVVRDAGEVEAGAADSGGEDAAPIEDGGASADASSMAGEDSGSMAPAPDASSSDLSGADAGEAGADAQSLAVRADASSPTGAPSMSSCRCACAARAGAGVSVSAVLPLAALIAARRRRRRRTLPARRRIR
jgi:hypothetical protein